MMTLEDKIYLVAEKLGTNKLKTQAFLRTVNYETLIPLLYYWPELYNDLLYPNMSKRAAELVFDDITNISKPTLEETELAADLALQVFSDPEYVKNLTEAYHFEEYW